MKGSNFQEIAIAETKSIVGAANLMHIFIAYSKVPPLRNYVIRNSCLISLNKIPLYKELSRLIRVQFLVQWYIAIL